MKRTCKPELTYLNDSSVKPYLPDAKPDAIWLKMFWKLAFLTASSIAETLIK